MNRPFPPSARPRERFIPNPKLRFLDQCREVMRFKQFAQRTEESYVDWIRRFIVWSGKRHPREMGTVEVRAFSRTWRRSATWRRRRKIRR